MLSRHSTRSQVRRTRLFTLLSAVLCAGLIAAARGDGGAPGENRRSDIEFSASVTAFHQPGADLDGGGDFRLSSGLFRVKATRPVSPSIVIGLSLKYDIDDYDFTGSTALGGLEPWNDVRRFGVGVPVFIRFGTGWLLGLSPSVDWLQERGADSSDSVAYGTPIFVARAFGREKRLGVGAGVFRNVEDEVEVFPFIAVDWRFNEKWRLSNPFEADVLGPAGLELTRTFDRRWSLGGGGVYRRFRFRLDDDGPSPGGIGENEGIVTFLHLKRSSRAGLDLNFHLGVTVGGKLELKDQDGDKLASSDYDPAPFLAVSLSGEF